MAFPLAWSLDVSRRFRSERVLRFMMHMLQDLKSLKALKLW